MVALHFLSDKAEADKINSALEHIDDRWRKLSVELGSIESMLHETIHHWKRYRASKDMLVKYMEEAERMLEAPPDKQMVGVTKAKAMQGYQTA